MSGMLKKGRERLRQGSSSEAQPVFAELSTEGDNRAITGLDARLSNCDRMTITKQTAIMVLVAWDVDLLRSQEGGRESETALSCSPSACDGTRRNYIRDAPFSSGVQHRAIRSCLLRRKWIFAH